MRQTFLCLALVAAAACDSPSSVADDLSFDIPSGLIGKGSTVSVAIVNDSERDAQTWALPCVVRLEKLVAGKWELASVPGPCPEIVTIVPAGGAASFDYLMPDEIGTWRLAVGVSFGNGGGVTIRTRSFQTVGIAVELALHHQPNIGVEVARRPITRHP